MRGEIKTKQEWTEWRGDWEAVGEKGESKGTEETKPAKGTNSWEKRG